MLPIASVARTAHFEAFPATLTLAYPLQAAGIFTHSAHSELLTTDLMCIDLSCSFSELDFFSIPRLNSCKAGWMVDICFSLLHGFI